MLAACNHPADARMLPQLRSGGESAPGGRPEERKDVWRRAAGFEYHRRRDGGGRAAQRGVHGPADKPVVGGVSSGEEETSRVIAGGDSDPLRCLQQRWRSRNVGAERRSPERISIRGSAVRVG